MAVTQYDLQEAVDTILAGAQKKNKILSDKEKCIVAYHEVGHAMVAALQSHSAPVQKITIVPRTSGALGFTMQVEDGDHTLMTKEERMRSEDMGNYYRVAADNRDLNYDKYFIKGQVHTQADEDYTSHNTRRLDVEGTIKKIMTTEYIQEALKEAGKA